MKFFRSPHHRIETLAPVGLMLWLLVGSVSAQPLAPGWHDDQAIEVDGQTRYFRYFVPQSPSEPHPAVVFFLHGGTGSMRASISGPANPSAEWPVVAEREGFILIVPNGINRDTGDAFGDDQNWNDCRDDAPGDFVGDDVAFLDRLMDWSLETLSVDPARVYFTGSSNGGMMTLRMVTERPERLAAAATFIANQPVSTQCSGPVDAVPILMAHGTEDPLMPYAGGDVFGEAGGSVISASDTVALWRDAARLAGQPQVDVLPDLDPVDGSTIEVRRWRDPSRGTEVRWWRMLGAGHAMPSIARPLSPAGEALSGPHNHDAEGAEEAWRFVQSFQSYPAVSDGQWVNADSAFHGQAQGLTLDYLPSAGQLFVAWFTYTDQPEFPPAIEDGSVGSPDQRWLTAQLAVNGNNASGPIFNSTGGRFDAPPTGFQTTEPVGTMQIEFSACNRATVTYNLDDPPLARELEIQPLEQLAVGQFVCPGNRATTDAVGKPDETAWAEVRAQLDGSGFDDLVAVVGDGRGRLFMHATGTSTDTTVMRSGSAIKWVTAGLILRLIEQGKLALSDTPQQYLDWWSDDPTDPRSQVTIEQLLSFTSGFRGTPIGASSPDCISDGADTIEGCAREIHDMWFFDPPGTTFWYGPSHMQILGAIAQAATGQAWAELFEQTLGAPLSMVTTTYTMPSPDNPRLAGGAQFTASDLEAFLAAMLDRSLLPTTWASMVEDQTPADTVEIGFTPIDESRYAWHYGLGVWRECPAPVWQSECDSPKVLSTTGAFGFHGWIDVDRGYYGILATDIGFGGADAVIDFAQQIRPRIEDALRVE